MEEKITFCFREKIPRKFQIFFSKFEIDVQHFTFFKLHTTCISSYIYLMCKTFENSYRLECSEEKCMHKGRNKMHSFSNVPIQSPVAKQKQLHSNNSESSLNGIGVYSVKIPSMHKCIQISVHVLGTVCISSMNERYNKLERCFEWRKKHWTAWRHLVKIIQIGIEIEAFEMFERMKRIHPTNDFRWCVSS